MITFLFAIVTALCFGLAAGYLLGTREAEKQISALREQLTYWARIAGSRKTPPPLPSQKDPP